MVTARFDIEKFDLKTKFTLWKIKILVILIQNDLKKALLWKK